MTNFFFKLKNDVLATCHTNISCLSSIKTSIIKNRDKNADKYDGQQLKKFDFYLFKLDGEFLIFR